MQALKNLITEKRREAPAAIDEQTVLHVAKKAIIEEYGARGGENIIPVSCKNKKLFLSPRSSLWANEIALHRTHLLEQINKRLGGREVREIKITH